MKSIIFAIVFLAATVTAADVCSLQCTEVSGNWTGETSVVVELGEYTEIIYEVNFKIFVVVNTQQNLVFATNSKFFLILNIETGVYILIDVKTNYAIYGKIKIDFRNSNGSINTTKLCITLNGLLTKYDSITSSTSSSFNFSLLILAFYSYQFDLTIIYEGQTELISVLNASFSAWFKLIREEIVSGSLQSGKCIWGFFVVILEGDIKVSLALFNLIRASIEYYGTIQIEIIIQIVRIIRVNIQEIIVFSNKFIDIISTSGSLTIKYVIEWVNNVRNNPVTVNFTVSGTVFTFSITKIDSQYVLRFTLNSNTGRAIDIKILYIQSVLVIINQQTNIAVALYGRSFVIVNVTSEYALVGTWKLIGGIRGTVVKAAQLSLDIEAQRYSKLAVDVKALINKYGNSGKFAFSQLYAACISGSVTQVEKVVGVEYARFVLLYYRGFFVESANGGSFGGIIVGVFANRRCVLISGFFAAAINGGATAGGNWLFIIQAIFKGSASATSVSKATTSYSYTYHIGGK